MRWRIVVGFTSKEVLPVMGPDPKQHRERYPRIVFMGTPSFASIILERLFEDGWNVVGAVTQPDRPRGRGRKVTPTPVSQVAQARGILVLQPKDMKSPVFLEDLTELRPDIIVVAAYGRILPGEVLFLPPLGCYNVHASVLPAYRGPAPVRWAIINGERTTGITIFRMDEGMDTGDVLVDESLEIGPDETAGMLTDRLAGLAAEMITPALEEIVAGTARFVPQDHEKATVVPILKKGDGLIDWSLSAELIRNRIRGLDPWPGAFTFWRGKRLRLWEAETGDGRSAGSPGEVLSVGDQGVVVQAKEGKLRLKEVQLEGGKRMPIEVFLRGHKMVPGEQLG
jgi:methionyl-tRNA formyltransferase